MLALDDALPPPSPQQILDLLQRKSLLTFLVSQPLCLSGDSSLSSLFCSIYLMTAGLQAQTNGLTPVAYPGASCTGRAAPPATAARAATLHLVPLHLADAFQLPPFLLIFDSYAGYLEFC